MFSCEIWETFKSTDFDDLQTTVSVFSQGSRTKFFDTEFSCEQNKKIKYNLWNKT